MKKITLLLLLFILLTGPLFSQVIPADRAKYKAITFFKELERKANPLKSASTVNVELFTTFTDVSRDGLKSAVLKEEPAFYIFNRNDQPGFVIVSAEERISDIIAWSDKSGICEINPAQQLLFDQYVKEVALARASNLSSPAIFSAGKEVLEPLLKNIEWNQSPAPYNSFCPQDRATARTCPVGCVALAMAQVIYYFKYPRVGTGNVTYASDYGVLSANFANAEYNYENMTGQPPVGVANADIAELCYHSALSLETDFGPYESSAYEGSVATALYKYFKYKQPAFRYLSNYSFETWKSMINKEILNSRPVIYGALDPLDPNKPDDVAGGHAFVLDGFTDEDQYHINWGWGGCSNGYYRLNLLTPSQCGDIYTFSDLHMMVTGIQPATTFECLMSVNKDSLQYEVSGGVREINVNSNTNWKVLVDVPWVNVSNTSGTGNQTLTFTVPSNEGFLDRSCEVKVTGCDEDRIIKVVQKGTCTLALSADTVYFPVREGSKKIGINATASWLTSSGSPWISVSPGIGNGKDSLLISVADNMGSSQRSGSIAISGCNSTLNIVVIQDGTCSLALSASSLFFNSEAAQQAVTIATGTSWTATSSAEWLSVLPAASTEGGILSVVVTENITNIRRTGVVTIKGCNADRTITVIQNGVCYMDLAALNVEFDPDAGYKFIRVSANSSWQAVTESCWLSVSPTNGMENDFLKIEVQPNTGQTARSGFIEVTACGSSRKISVIQQSYCLLDVTTTILDFSYFEGIKSASVISTGSWSVSADAPWITVTPATGRKLGVVSVSVPANNTNKKRSGNVTITGCYTTQNITVTQDPCTLTLSGNSLVFPHEPALKTVTIQSNSAWTASADSKWVTVTPTFSTENGIVSVSTEANLLQKRKAVLTIVGCFASQTVDLLQEGNPTPVLDLEDNGISVYPTITDRFVKVGLPSGISGYSLDVLTETGQKILSKSQVSSGEEIDLRNFAKGVYYFRISSRRVSEIKKIVLR